MVLNKLSENASKSGTTGRLGKNMYKKWCELRNINRCESIFANSRQDSKGEGLYQTWTALDDQFTLTRTTLFN